MRQLLMLALLAAIGYGLIWFLRPRSRGAPRAGTDPRASSWFELLGVGEDASVEEITHAYRRLIVQYHPDRVAQMGPEIRQVAEEKSQQIISAYEQGLALRRAGR